MDRSKKIQIISASAGSGKTYRLAHLLEEEVRSGRVRPDAILATTFTKKAAAELQERVRTRLLSAGLTTQAHQLAAARIGTVNSVCGKLLSDFAFDLGISPHQQVIQEELVSEAIRKSLGRTIDRKTSKSIWGLEQIFPGTNVRDVVEVIIGKARANRLSADQLKDCARRSTQEFLQLFDDPTPYGTARDQELKRGLNTWLQEVDLENDKTKDTKKVFDKIQTLKNKLNYKKRLPWCDWLVLTKLKSGAKSRELTTEVVELAEWHDKHPALREDVTRLIELVFSIAAQTLSGYQKYKDERGIIDFIDQEARFLDLLEMDEPAAIIADQLDLVLVDEFQDTSPIQLAIFLKLSDLANKSVWVGDQKQSIYGFRDADPSLMDAAINGILADAEPETLTNSWRSRPELVRSSSDIFVEAFKTQEFPEQRVRLEPAEKVITEEPEGLSPVYEYWQLDSTNRDNDALSLAKATKDFLSREDNTIRDPLTGEKRRALGGDIAILCRANKVAVEVAGALEQQGIKVALPRPGLLNQPEIIVSLAAVRLLVDSYDSLAKAEISRFLDTPDNHNAFLQKALNEPYGQGFDNDVFSKLKTAQMELSMASPLEIVDLAFNILDIKSYCQAWGNGSERIANLDTLRNYCVCYVDECVSASQGASTIGLMNWLASKDDDDVEQAVVQDADTVQIMTWHKAKGLEWPVTVLFQLDKTYTPLPFGINAVGDEKFKLTDPLANRWLRYWPDPYKNPINKYAFSSTGAPIHERIQETDIAKNYLETEKRQELRLLYVGWTRARDKVVLAGRKDCLQKGILRLLTDKEDEHLLQSPTENNALWAGREIEIYCHTAAPGEPTVRSLQTASVYKSSEPVKYPQAYISPSSFEKEGRVGDLQNLGERLPLTGKPDMQLLGEAIHTFLGADRMHCDMEQRRTMAGTILTRWQVDKYMSADNLVTASDRLHKWLGAQWESSKLYREYPVSLQLDGGSIISGYIDMLLETEQGFVIIDHKSFPGSDKEATLKAASFAGQLDAYTQGVMLSTGKDVLGCYIHLPVSGGVIEVSNV